MKKFTLLKHTFRSIIILLMVIYFGLIALLNIPKVQHGISSLATRELSRLLNTEVKIGNIDLGLLNRIIINDFEVYDQTGAKMINIARFSAKFDIHALISGKIRINSVQLFGSDINLTKKNRDADLAPKEKKEKKEFIDLRVNSLLIRRGNINFDVLSEKETDSVFNPSHIAVRNLSANVSLKALTKDSLNIEVKRFSASEKSGLTLRRLSFKAIGNHQRMSVRDFDISLPKSRISIDSISTQFIDFSNLGNIASIGYNGTLFARFVPSDLKSIVPGLKHFNDTVNIKSDFYGGDNRHTIKSLQLYSNKRQVNINVGGYFIPRHDSTDTSFDLDIKKIEIHGNGANWIFKNVRGNETLPDIASRIASASLSGEIKGTPHRIENKLSLSTPLGNLQSHFVTNMDSSNNRRSYSGRFFSEELDLGKLMKKENILGKTSFNVTLNGLTYMNNKPESYVKGKISSIEVKGYNYQNILLDGQYKSGGFNGHISIDDRNVRFNMDGSFSTAGEMPVFRLMAQIRDFRPDKLKLSDKYVNTAYSLNLGADFTGNSIDDIEGKIEIDSLSCVSENVENNYFLPSFKLIASKKDDGKTVDIKSDFFNGQIVGNYSYKTITSSIVKVAYRYIPSFFEEDNQLIRQETENNFSMQFRMDNSDFLNKVYIKRLYRRL